MSVHVTISPEWERWVRGFQNVGGDVEEAAERTFKQAGEAFFAATQNNVHVLSGDLLSTGRVETRGTGSEVTTEVMYGGIPGASGTLVDYAIHEENRGGSHAFIERGWEQTERMFSQALPDAWDAVVMSWR